MQSFSKIIMLAGLALSLSQQAVAGAGSHGESGVKIDDRIVSADSMRPGLQGQKCQFSYELRADLERAGTLLVRYGADYVQRKDQRGYPLYVDSHLSESQESNFIAQNVLSPDTEYRCVTEIPNYPECKDEFTLKKGENGEVVAVACTMGPITWLRYDLLSKMILREQTKVIMHERFHTIDIPGVNSEVAHSMIADVTNALGTLMDIYNAQILGARPELSEEQWNEATTLIHRIGQMRLNTNRPDLHDYYGSPETYGEKFRVNRLGGGLVESWNDHENAYVGVGSVVQGEVGKSAVVIDTYCYDPRPGHHVDCFIKPGAKLQSVNVQADGKKSFIGINIGENAQLKDVEIHLLNRDVPEFASNTQVGQWEEKVDFLVGKQAWLSNVTFTDLRMVRVGAYSAIQNFHFDGYVSRKSNSPNLVISDSSSFRFFGAQSYDQESLTINGMDWYATTPSRSYPQLVFAPHFVYEPVSKYMVGEGVMAMGYTEIKNMKEYRKAAGYK